MTGTRRTSRHVTSTLNPTDAATWVSTNTTALYGLAAIQTLTAARHRAFVAVGRRPRESRSSGVEGGLGAAAPRVAEDRRGCRDGGAVRLAGWPRSG